MAWISVHEQLKEHHKLRALAKLADISRHEACGLLVFLWMWGLNNADRDGNLNGADERDIAMGVMSIGLSKEISPKRLVECLVESCWIEKIEESYCLHDWDFWQKEWFKAVDNKKSDTERKRVERAVKKQAQLGGNLPCPSDNPSDSNTDIPSDVRHSPNLTLPNHNLANNSSKEANKLASARSHPDYLGIMEMFNSICKSVPKVLAMSDARKRTVKAWNPTDQEVVDLFQKVASSDFLTGKKTDFTASFDWVIKPANRQKIIEGQYDNKLPQHETSRGNVVGQTETMFDRLRAKAKEGTL